MATGTILDQEFGTYNPTFVPTGNITNTPIAGGETKYIKVGDIVMVSGQVYVDPDAAATVSNFTMTLPIAKTFSAALDLSGIASSHKDTNGSWKIRADTATKSKAFFEIDSCAYTSGEYLGFQFMYKL